jgi:hypothetical protein
MTFLADFRLFTRALLLDPSQFFHDDFIFDHLLLHQGQGGLGTHKLRLEGALVHLLLDFRVLMDLFEGIGKDLDDLIFIPAAWAKND